MVEGVGAEPLVATTFAQQLGRAGRAGHAWAGAGSEGGLLGLSVQGGEHADL